MKVGRVKFAVKEIRYKEAMDIDQSNNKAAQPLNPA